ncbi:response regulator transcription factor [Allosphingosinicella deserti]|uniref:DNA-binding response regulator n=1 Tax=Allosphingosinicella deserti TaxID=2116704 RepID=A0A2P7QVF2_9SPHN|nr:response regulator [Sphingomonas deserti]PSJ41942.1 DNA-binding response regulator [Sphingomonas deserti]
MTTRTIYVVDDDDDVRLSLQSLLSVLPNTLVWGFRSGDAFLERAEELGPGVILLDYHMPGSTGLDVLKAIQPYGPKFVAVILTGHGEVSLAVEAMKSGALDFLEKPYEHDALIEVLNSACGQLEESSEQTARVNAAKAKIEKLSAREVQVMHGLIAGRSNKVIAYDLDLSPRTIEIYRANLMDKLEVTNLSDILRIAFTAGLVPSA